MAKKTIEKKITLGRDAEGQTEDKLGFGDHPKPSLSSVWGVPLGTPYFYEPLGIMRITGLKPSK